METAMNNTPDLQTWEKVEVERSAFEAQHHDLNNLLIPAREISRYLNPPQNTVFPLEYSYFLLGDVTGKTVLDYGCGTGDNTVLLVKRGAKKIISLDISQDLIEVAEKRLEVNNVSAEKVDFTVGSAHDIPLPDESVDVVFGMAILHHLDLKLSSKEVFRVLKKGGRAIFQEPVRNSKMMWFIRGLIPYQAPDVSPFERPLTDTELKEYGKNFATFEKKAFSLPTLNLAQMLPVIKKYWKQMYRLDHTVLKTIPPLNYYATIRVIEMTK